MNKNSVIKLHYGGQAVSHCDLKSGEGLKSLWLEIPEYCHLFCSYCFASTNSNENRNCTAKRSTDYLKWDDYKKLLSDFAEAGGKFIGIPGRGEPFHPENLELVKKIINHANDLNLKTTIFTTGETIFFKPEYISQDGEMKVLKTDVEPQFDLMNFLKTKDVVLLIKWNSDNEEVQDRLVNTKNYTKLRAKSLNLLLENEFNRENTPKLGIVTSILKDNQAEIIELYRKYHKGKGLIFDCDTILPRGRGNKYLTENKEVLTHKDLKDIFVELKKEGAILTCQGGTYVGVACDRILHHLYVSITGDVYPCIGCFENGSKKNFKLGNIKSSEGGHENTILKFWQSPIRTKLRTGIDEVFDGVCAKCENFKNKTCYSCLGRYVDEVKREEKDILITTSGCTNHVPNYFEWIIQSEEYFRELLSEPETQRLFKENFENLWEPNRNITFRINQCPEGKRKDFIKHLLIEYKDPHSKGCNDKKCYEGDWTSKFSCIKHYKYSDLNFPMNAVYDFISVPLSFYKNEEYQGSEEKCKNKLVSILSKSLLSNIFLPSMKVLFDKEDEDNNIILCNFLFFNNKEQKYFYRTVSKNDNKFNQAFILFRWAENFGDINYYSSESKGKIFNMSRYFRNKKNNSMYELILGESPNTNHIPKGQRIFLKEILDNDLVREKAENIGNELEDFCNKAGIQQIIETCNKKIFSAYPNDEAVKDLRYFYESLNLKLIQNESNIPDENEKRENILKEFKDLMKKNSQSDKDFIDNIVSEEKSAELINYFIFLRVLRDVLGINHYYLTHSNSYHFLEQNRDSLLRVSGIQPSGMLVCSKEPLKTDLVNKIKIFTETIFSPIDAFYYMDAKKEVLRQATRVAISQVMSRNMSHNLGSHVITNTKSDIIEIAEANPSHARELLGLASLLHYLQERQDFIAVVTGDERYAKTSINFKAHVFDMLAYDGPALRHKTSTTPQQKNYILDNIVRSENYDRNNIELILEIPDPDNKDSENYIQLKSKHSNDASNAFNNIFLSIPYGINGRQGFLAILENFIRNSAKHEKDSNLRELNFTIRIEDKEGDNGKKQITIYDNKKNAQVVIKKLQGQIQGEGQKRGLLDSEGNIQSNFLSITEQSKHEFKGIKEMLICVAWLKGEHDYTKALDNPAHFLQIVDIGDNFGIQFELDTHLLVRNIDEKDKDNQNRSADIYYTRFKDTFETNKQIYPRLVLLGQEDTKNYENTMADFEELYKMYFKERFGDLSAYKIYVIDTNKAKSNDKTFCFLENGEIDSKYKTIIEHIDNLSSKDTDVKYRIVFKNHYETFGKDNQFEVVADNYYLEGISGSNYTHSLLRNGEFDEMKAMRIVESCQTKILVVDERMFEKYKKGPREERKKAFSEDIVNKILERKSEFHDSQSGYDYAKIADVSDEVLNLKKGESVGLRFDSAIQNDEELKEYLKDFEVEVNNRKKKNYNDYFRGKNIDIATYNFSKKELEFVSERPLNDYHFVSIHYGLIEKFNAAEKEKYANNNIINALASFIKEKIPQNPETQSSFVSIHSGRGDLHKFKDNNHNIITFIPLSGLEWTIENSKYTSTELFYSEIYNPITQKEDEHNK